MHIGQHVPASRHIPGFPRGIATQATIYDDERVVGFVVGLNQCSPLTCGLSRIEDCLSAGWKCFLDSSYPDKGLRNWKFWAVIHRTDVPRSELEGRIKL